MFDQPAFGKNRPTVLVIAPSAANRGQICECLHQLPDIRTVATGEGEQALKIIQESWPSMVLLDDALQGIDGISLTRTIRTWERSRDEAGFSPWTPIVLLSSVIDEDVLAKGILAGADDFLYKPVSEVVLLAKVRAMLRKIGRAHV